MRLPIWRIRALAIVTLLFITGSAAAQGTTREQLIGTWWIPTDESESVGGVWRFRDDGIMTVRIMYSPSALGSIQTADNLYARWELENDRLTVTPVRLWGNFDPSGLSRTFMIAFEDEALILTEPDSDERYTFQPGGIPPEAIPEGNALHGTVAYSDGPYHWIEVGAFKLEKDGEDVFAVLGAAAILLVEGEWEFFGLDDGAWFVVAFAVYEGEEGEDNYVASGIIASEAGDVIDGPIVDGIFSDGGDEVLDIKILLAGFNGILLGGGQQVVTGIDIVLRAPGTTVEAVAWGEVKALFR